MSPRAGTGTGTGGALPRLAGTVVMPQQKYAIFEGSPRNIVLREGDMLHGMAIERIDAGHIILNAAGQRIRMVVTRSGSVDAVPDMPRIADRAPDGQHEE